MRCWHKTLWLVKRSHVTWTMQSECFISALYWLLNANICLWHRVVFLFHPTGIKCHYWLFEKCPNRPVNCLWRVHLVSVATSSNETSIASQTCPGRYLHILFFKKGHPRPLFNLFSSFQTNITIFTTNICEKCHDHPVYGAGIRTHDLRNTSLLP